MKFATLLFGEYESGLRTRKFKEQTSGVFDEESVWFEGKCELIVTVKVFGQIWLRIIHWIWSWVIQFKGHFIIYKRLRFMCSLEDQSSLPLIRLFMMKYENHFCIIRVLSVCEMHNPIHTKLLEKNKTRMCHFCFVKKFNWRPPNWIFWIRNIVIVKMSSTPWFILKTNMYSDYHGNMWMWNTWNLPLLLYCLVNMKVVCRQGNLRNKQVECLIKRVFSLKKKVNWMWQWKCLDRYDWALFIKFGAK